MEKNLEAQKARIDHWIWGLHLMALVIMGLALFPMIFFFYSVWQGLAAQPAWFKILMFSFSIALGFFLFGLTLIFLCVLFKNIFRFKVTPGLHSMYSSQAISWMAYNSLILLANGAFLDIFRISPFQVLFYRLMGARVGNDVRVNTGGLADLSLLEIGDNSVVGGGVALIAHAFERGFLRLEPVKIGKNVTIGLGSIIMPGCEIGDGASIAPCSLLTRGTKIPPKGVWGGNPVHDLRAARRRELDLDL
ncbi:MAG: hypothetical protein HY592_06605 [Candidatus Omnitrophica bacterium]|nr:hypothetical protein [Candidatus Omnitrophota bacterium]